MVLPERRDCQVTPIAVGRYTYLASPRFPGKSAPISAAALSEEAAPEAGGGRGASAAEAFAAYAEDDGDHSVHLPQPPHPCRVQFHHPQVLIGTLSALDGAHGGVRLAVFRAPLGIAASGGRGGRSRGADHRALLAEASPEGVALSGPRPDEDAL
eukprot:CAMPEP_0177219210 /NCGR_PEP_ID=MMETSP0367-20130122/36234_1 /TAXON_ID=447022 ORGANISM="Scrippsiella hangoei-like, Strain SHHI-4" /NCGR_SAMPLE_ID=MMETSP0367 /ASSEMBLY_ACC=CAM_ASM_000362 /LENGTH=154 /DNA_ID=CAMNT_0018668907 /DNA_START=8 /DNA_END=471 /DNA_ORIENTATION=-